MPMDYLSLVNELSSKVPILRGIPSLYLMLLPSLNLLGEYTGLICVLMVVSMEFRFQLLQPPLGPATRGDIWKGPGK